MTGKLTSCRRWKRRALSHRNSGSGAQLRITGTPAY